MSIGFKIKKLREEKNLSQTELASMLKISQPELSKIENDQVEKIDFLFMDKVCKYFDKDFDFFTENTNQINNVKKNTGTIAVNVGTINNCPENLLEQIKTIFDENIQNKEIIKALRSENKMLRK
jgi:transcriptional regulator with XRE-family HTH domain